ncbi:Trehalose transport system permease protein SugB [Marinomonas spartinae]|uniref:Trehalose transport system permease protein SugB n=1 Tax=Marinomonas spartinae TaxID=1792290 RepID=A0A1A8TRV4_9GAMM|nr:ABC transporter permease subunit [Marinomonas spartinae]SBS35983.1 Trehalose transport system permease protein SugB [Marinomonas spartinae]
MNKPCTNRLIILLVIGFCCISLVLPFSLAMLWSLVDPGHPWSYPHILPPVLSLQRWVDIWTTTSLPQALLHSYLLAPCVALCSVLLALPTAYAFGRLEFPGKQAAQLISLLPLIVPSFVVALFFSSLLNVLGIYSRFLGILIGQTVLFIPYAIRILSVSFSLIRQEIIDATRDLGGGPITVFKTAYLPVLKPGLLASIIMIFILSIEEFAIAFVVGSPDFVTVPTILYSYLGYNFIRSNAAVVSLILVVPNIFLMLLMERFLKARNTAVITGKG